MAQRQARLQDVSKYQGQQYMRVNLVRFKIRLTNFTGESKSKYLKTRFYLESFFHHRRCGQ